MCFETYTADFPKMAHGFGVFQEEHDVAQRVYTSNTDPL
jgi:hypothetical protein